MMLDPEPKFEVGDKVTNFRGGPATIFTVRRVNAPGKSHRVRVIWEGEALFDPIEYYEEVFTKYEEVQEH